MVFQIQLAKNLQAVPLTRDYMSATNAPDRQIMRLHTNRPPHRKLLLRLGGLLTD
jgi:hypothetical protein